MELKYNDAHPPIQCIMHQSTCYKGTGQMQIRGVLIHSTGANNPTLKRYVQPDDNAGNREELLEIIGVNKNKNDWNHLQRQAGVNAWIGKLANGNVATVQALPWNYRPWGCGSGPKGSCNNGWIQFEICEDGLNDKNYFTQIYEETIQLVAFLCRKFNIDPKGRVNYNGLNVPTILCHADSYTYGLGNNHGDVNHWFPKFGKSMDTVREDVANLLKAPTSRVPSTPSTPNVPSKPATIEVGDLVTIKTGATYYGTNKIVPSWVQQDKWYVYRIDANGRVVINRNENKTATIMSPIDAKYLEKVEKEFVPYKVRVKAALLNYRAGPGVEYEVKGIIVYNQVYTIVGEASDSYGQIWGKLKSGAGWISLKYVDKE